MVDRLSAIAQGPVPFSLVVVAPKGADVSQAVQSDGLTTIEDADGLLKKRFDAQPGSLYLLRPDQHVCARWRTWTESDVLAAVNRATCNG